MPFAEKKSFQMPLVGGSVIVPEIQESKKEVNGCEVVELSTVLVDQAHRKMPEGEDALQYQAEFMIRSGMPMKKVNSIMIYPKSINPQLVEEKPAGASEEKAAGTSEEKPEETKGEN